MCAIGSYASVRSYVFYNFCNGAKRLNAAPI